MWCRRLNTRPERQPAESRTHGAGRVEWRAARVLVVAHLEFVGRGGLRGAEDGKQHVVRGRTELSCVPLWEELHWPLLRHGWQSERAVGHALLLQHAVLS